MESPSPFRVFPERKALDKKLPWLDNVAAPQAGKPLSPLRVHVSPWLCAALSSPRKTLREHLPSIPIFHRVIEVRLLPFSLLGSPHFLPRLFSPYPDNAIAIRSFSINPRCLLSTPSVDVFYLLLRKKLASGFLDTRPAHTGATACFRGACTLAQHGF